MNTSLQITPSLGLPQPPGTTHVPVGQRGETGIGADLPLLETPSRVFTVAQPTAAPGVLGFSSSPAPPFRGPGLDWAGPRRKMQGIMEAIRRNEFDPSDSKAPWKLLELQVSIQEVGMEIEIASKIVEHATSATKTVLQTQA